MQEINGTLWDYHAKGFFIVIPTNGFIKNNGECVMGRGLALQTTKRFPNFAKELGEMIEICNEQHVFLFPEEKIFTFPVKDKWWEPATLELIEQSCKELKKMVDIWKEILLPVYLPRVGCGNGRLDWKDVKPILERILDEKFIVCDLKK